MQSPALALLNPNPPLYPQAIKEIIGPSEDIPAPDMNTGAREMAWFFDEYSKYKGFSPGVVTGKVRHSNSHFCVCVCERVRPSTPEPQTPKS